MNTYKIQVETNRMTDLLMVRGNAELVKELTYALNDDTVKSIVITKLP